jgi:hypothetical protein
MGLRSQVTVVTKNVRSPGLSISTAAKAALFFTFFRTAEAVRFHGRVSNFSHG